MNRYHISTIMMINEHTIIAIAITFDFLLPVPVCTLLSTASGLLKEYTLLLVYISSAFPMHLPSYIYSMPPMQLAPTEIPFMSSSFTRVVTPFISHFLGTANVAAPDTVNCAVGSFSSTLAYTCPPLSFNLRGILSACNILKRLNV